MSAPSSYRLMQVMAVAQATLDRLREDDGLVMETEDELRAALADEGVSVDNILARLGSAALDAKAYGEAVEERIAVMRGRRERFQRHETMIRETLFQAMQSIGLTSFGHPEFSATISNGKPKVIVTDPDALPTSCIRIKHEPDKKAIADALGLGPVPGAELSNAAPVLTIRSK